jgi:hypothetical protein
MPSNNSDDLGIIELVDSRRYALIHARCADFAALSRVLHQSVAPLDAG